VAEAVRAVLTNPAKGNTCSGLGARERGRDGQDGAGATLAVGELAARLRRYRIHVSQTTLEGFLRAWQRQGIAEQVEPGRWRLTPEGGRRFAGFSIIGRG
jgi:hypothetical protein